MNETGELVEWNDDRGFGFVEPRGGGRLFVHISAFQRPLRRPEAGDRLAFKRGPGKDGREAVIAAHIAGAMPQPQPPSSTTDRAQSARPARALRLLAAGLLIGAAMVLPLPAIVPLTYLGMGAASFLAYWVDKRAAMAGAWRISEATLHGLDLIGGIGGGLLAQVALHHKTAKPMFAVTTSVIAFCHIAGLVGLAFWPEATGWP